MSRYSKVVPGIWDDDKVRELSAPKPNAQTLWFYIITGPHVTSLPGLWRLSPGTIAENLGWPTSAVRRFLQEIEEKSLARLDFRSRVVFVPGRFKHDQPTSPNTMKHWRARFDEIPDSNLKDLWLKRAYDLLDDLPDAFRYAFTHAFPEVVRTTSGTPEPEPEPEPQPEPEPGPEPEPKTRSEITPEIGAAQSPKGGTVEPDNLAHPNPGQGPEARHRDPTVDEQLADRLEWKREKERLKAQIAADSTPYDKPGDAARRLEAKAAAALPNETPGPPTRERPEKRNVPQLIRKLAEGSKMENAVGPGEIKSQLRAKDRRARAVQSSPAVAGRGG
ncbi:MAG TPA: hypothetical protein VFG76_05195 [Candidatus Polarisedimenticolia bacterium]|nr:hypothetical protein [Candidatus Polarisedimenticolia bacterium]